MAIHSIQWRRLDGPGMETFELNEGEPGGPRLRGTAAGAIRGRPFALRYEVECDDDWLPRHAEVTVDLPAVKKSLKLSQDDGTWQIDGREAPELEGCRDLDLAFSPSTNTLPIRRFALKVGELGSTRAAWVLFPTLEVRSIDQQYRRVAVDRYRYRSGDAEREYQGGFRTVLTVGAGGLVMEFPGLWRASRDGSGNPHGPA
ncbi:MAG: putative glycolipid-binding domain-containing protein [Thermoanaerobaculia bacterium]|nr:putative glycolipid-binding domain-containing protein [Thermoanaerobaculia bacterium]